MAERDRKQLLLVGGGHAHLGVIAALIERVEAGRANHASRVDSAGSDAPDPIAGWDVTLVSPHPRQVYTGMLPGWVAGHYAIDELTVPLKALAARARLLLVQTSVTEISLERRVAHCADGQALPFDLVSIDTGPEPASAGLIGTSAHALAVRPLENFIEGWPRIVERWPHDGAAFDLLVIGGGAAAVELAFAAHERARREGAALRVSLVGADAQPLSGTSHTVIRRALARLHERGIRWIGSSRVTQIEAQRVVLDGGTTLACDACLVATGAAAPEWPRAAGLATDADGYIRTDAALRSVSHPFVYAAGDVAALLSPRPKSGVYAVRAGVVLARNLIAACTGAPQQVWRPPRRALYLLSTADGRAIASWGAWGASGRWVWRWKDRIDRRFVRRYVPGP